MVVWNIIITDEKSHVTTSYTLHDIEDTRYYTCRKISKPHKLHAIETPGVSITYCKKENVAYTY